jgi:hypothetical protein
MFWLTAAAGAAAPEVLRAGIEPATVHPGESFTLYADVHDADGAADVDVVAVMYEGDYLLSLPRVHDGYYAETFVMPSDAPELLITLEVMAADRAANVSGSVEFAVAIAGPGGGDVTLLSPEDGALLGCEDAPTFAWLPVPAAEGYMFEVYLPTGEVGVLPLPPDVTEVPVPGAAWMLVPDGVYQWRVGYVTEPGGEVTGWSELWSFTKDCYGGGETEIFGWVREIDPEEQTFVVCTGMHLDQVQATEETRFEDLLGNELSFDDLERGTFVAVTGERQGDLLVASLVVIYGSTPPPPPPPPPVLIGEIVEVLPEEHQILVAPEHGPGHHDRVLVQVTDETLIVNLFGEILEFDDLEAGMMVGIEGEWEGDLLVAAVITVMDEEPPPPPPGTLMGEIVEISAEELQFLVDAEWGDMVAVQVTDETEIVTMFGEPLEFSDLQVGMFVMVEGEYEGDLLFARLVMVMDEEPPPPPTTLMGTIAEIFPEEWQLLVAPETDGLVRVQVTDHTRIMTQFGEPLKFEDLEVGQFVGIEGEFEGDLLVASVIMVMDEEPPPPPGVAVGEIAEILPDAHQFVLHTEMGREILVQVTDDTEIFNIHGEPMEFADLQVGMFVGVEGEFEGDILIARTIVVHDGGPPPPPGETVLGTIAEIDPDQMVLYVEPFYASLITVQVTDETLIFDSQGNPLEFADLSVGMYIGAEGEFEGDVLFARIIVVHDGGPPPPPPGETVVGTIAEIDPDQMLLYVEPFHASLVTVQVTDETLIFDSQGNPLEFADLTVGMYIGAEGEFQGDVLFARVIIVHDGGPPPPPPGDVVLGTIQEIDPDQMLLYIQPDHASLITIQVTDETLIFNMHGELLDFSDLEVGMRIGAEGAFEGELFIARIITVLDGGPPPPPPPPGILLGTIQEIDAAAMQLFVEPEWQSLVTVQVTDETLIFNLYGELLDFSDLEVGMRIGVEGEYEGDLLYANVITVMEEGPPPPPPPPSGTAEGFVQAIDYDLLTLQLGFPGTPASDVQATPETVILDRHGQPLDFTDIEVGDLAVATGAWEGDILVAEMIFVQKL